jgi:hypothetical protein
MFLQTINFDAAFQQLGLRGYGSGAVNTENGDDDEEEETDANRLQQQQEMEQALLLQRFKALRQMQMEQQELLMRQQKQQLEVLRKEQMTVESVLSKNRDSKMGGASVNDDALTRTPPPSQRFTRPREVDRNPKSFNAKSSQNVPQQEQMLTSGTLPVPVMYVPLNEDNDEVNTNPDLFSDTNSRTSEMTEERLYREEMVHKRMKLPSEDEKEMADEVEDDYEDEEEPDDQLESLSDYDIEEEDFDEQDEMKNEEITDPDERRILVTKTFEELLEEQLKAESEKRNSENARSMDSPKHQFLKKGQGIARFGSLKDKKSNIRPPPRPQPEKSLALKINTSQQTEKLAAKNPQHQTKLSLKTNVKKQNENRNSEKTLKSGNPVMTKPTAGKGTSDPKNTKPPHTTQGQTSSSKMLRNNSKQDEQRRGGPRRSSIPDDVSFVGRLHQREMNEELEQGDLEEFEMLENLADNMSYCSNTSVMVQKMEERVRDKKKSQSKLVLKPLVQTVKPGVQNNGAREKMAAKLRKVSCASEKSAVVSCA